MPKTISWQRLVGQFSSFWLVWLIVQYLINVPLEHHLSAWPQELAVDAVKLLVWLGGGWWFIHHASPQDLTVTNRQQWRPNWTFTTGYWVLGALIVYLLAQFWFTHHGLHVSRTFVPQYWGRYFLVVGITEEFVFRGYFLNVLLTRLPQNQANLIQTLAFTAMHIPRYLTTVPAMSPLVWLTNLVSVAILGSLFGWLYAKSHSLWPGIVTHMTWDILVTAFG